MRATIFVLPRVVQEKRLRQEGAEEAARERTIAREREWIQQSPKARQAKSKARINAYDELLSKSQEQRGGTAQIVIPVAERLGSVVIEAENLAKGYDDRLLYENVEFLAAARRHRSASSAPMAPARRR